VGAFTLSNFLINTFSEKIIAEYKGMFRIAHDEMIQVPTVGNTVKTRGFSTDRVTESCLDLTLYLPRSLLGGVLRYNPETIKGIWMRKCGAQ